MANDGLHSLSDINSLQQSSPLWNTFGGRERTTRREAEFRQLAVGMTKPKATEIESPPHNCPANPMAS